MNEDLELLLAERAIQRVLTSYSRGVDRHDFELVRSYYWPDGTDDHGSFVGGVDDFITFPGEVAEPLRADRPLPGQHVD